jgi:hypothetical protein
MKCLALAEQTQMDARFLVGACLFLVILRVTMRVVLLKAAL